jgi:hypothetical protein
MKTKTLAAGFFQLRYPLQRPFLRMGKFSGLRCRLQCRRLSLKTLVAEKSRDR